MTIEEIQALIHNDETRTLELKKTTGELKDGMRSACAFLNTAGDDDRIEIENTGHLPEGLTTETIKLSHHSYPQNPTIADVLFKTTFLENWGSGIGRIMDVCREANLPEPEYNQDASFVWVTFKRNTIQPFNPTTPTTPTTLKREDVREKRLKALLSAIGESGANLKALMEAMQRKDRKGFVSTYITPNIESGYIAMLYPDTPNHPMQSYFLTNKGREALNNLSAKRSGDVPESEIL